MEVIKKINNITYCGHIALIGRSNVGKSTIFNQLINKKISITSRKINTTRSCIFGIFTENIYQYIYIDTPGIHINTKHNYKIFNNCALILFIVEAIKWNINDEKILKIVKNIKIPIILIINKIDLIRKKLLLLPYIQMLKEKIYGVNFIPISAKKRKNIILITNIVKKYLCIQKHLYPKNLNTIHSKIFLISEIIREKLFRFLGEELPYSTFIKIDNIQFKNDIYIINSTIFVKKESQKKIIIGKKGEKINKILNKSSKDIKNMFNKNVNLKLWVKLKKIF